MTASDLFSHQTFSAFPDNYNGRGHTFATGTRTKIVPPKTVRDPEAPQPTTLDNTKSPMRRGPLPPDSYGWRPSGWFPLK